MLRRPRNQRFSTMGGFLERHLPRFLLHCQVSIIININHHHRNHNLANQHNHRNCHHHHWEDFLSCTNSDSCCTVLGCKIHHLQLFHCSQTFNLYVLLSPQVTVSITQITTFFFPSYPDCGRQARRTSETTSVYERIHVRGCISVVGRALEHHVMPMLLAWGLLGIMVGLAELLLLFLCLLFANHLRSGGGHTRLTSAPGKCELEPLAYTSTASLARQQKYTSTLSVRLT